MQNTSLSLCTAGYLLRIDRCGGTRWCRGGGWERSAQAAGTAEGGNLGTVKTWAFADLTLLLFLLAGNTENTRKQTQWMWPAAVYLIKLWRFLFLPSGHWYWSHIRHYLGRVQWTKYTYNRQKCLYAGIKMSESVVKKWLQKRLWLWINCVCWCRSFVWEDED